jgi:hypothetical protein
MLGYNCAIHTCFSSTCSFDLSVAPMSVPATVINATALVRMKVRRLAIGVLGIALDGGRETVDLADPLSLDDISVSINHEGSGRDISHA